MKLNYSDSVVENFRELVYRALSRSRLLFMDEAFSSLDLAMEKRIRKFIDYYCGDISFIEVSHRQLESSRLTHIIDMPNLYT